MDSVERAVLSVATLLLAISASVILWNELGHSAPGGFLPRWRDYLGIGMTIGGLVVLLTWLWAS